jgi:hypothetical protein
MKSLRKILLILSVTAALGGAGLIESFNLLAAKHRDQVTQELQKVFGQDVSFGSLEVNVFGRPGFVATDFRIADDSRFAATPAVRARELVLGLSLRDLVFGRFVITSLTFDEPEFQIITDEGGVLNLMALVDRKAELRKFPKLRAPSPERRPVPVSFAIDEVAIKRGRIDYVDRSVKQPAELRARNVSMNIKGFQLNENTEIRVAAALTEGLGEDVRIRGRLSPPGQTLSWSQRPLDLSVQFDSLHVPVVARAIAVLRDKIPAELDVTGPMALQVRARGTVERPRLEDITLKVPLFGSSDYNAVITGEVKFSEQRTWEDAELKGDLAVDGLSLARLRSLKFLEQTLPAALTSEGSVRVVSRFEGTWEKLRLGALVRADKADVRYREWFHKPAEFPATIRAQISKQSQRLVFHPSEVEFGPNKVEVAGSIEREPAPRLRIKVRNKRGSIVGWSKLMVLPSFQPISGTVDIDLSLAKGLSGSDTPWSLLGGVKIHGATFNHRGSGRRIEDLQASVAFDGIKARVENGRFRLGGSLIYVSGSTANVFEPRLRSTIRSPELALADLPMLSPNPSVRLRDVLGQAEIFSENNQWVLVGSIAAPQGVLNAWSLRDLRADIALAAAGLTFRNFQAHTLDGVISADGFWPAKGEQSRLQFSSRIDAIDVRGLLAQWLPPFRDRLQGRLNGYAEFHANGTEGGNRKEGMRGSGEASLQRGTIKEFNLIGQLLLKGSGSAVSAAALSRVPPGFAALFNQPDTSIESLKATFTLDQKRVFTENLVLTTPDYTITGAGSIGYDRWTRWNGLLVLSPRLTQEVQRDYRIVRYLLDRRGRLAVSFRIEGQIPDISIRLENRALAQALRTGTGGADEQGGELPQDGKNWLPDALERFLKR